MYEYDPRYWLTVLWGYAFLAAAILVALAVAAMIGYTVFWYGRNWFSRARTVQAEVLRKKIRRSDTLDWLESTQSSLSRRSSAKERLENLHERFRAWIGLRELSIIDGTDCIVVFRAGRGEKEFCVPARVFAEVDEGDRGMLCFKGEQFRSFTLSSRRPGS